jgi:poly-beta-1,6-N-acetyl-D-glucosamine synthase
MSARKYIIITPARNEEEFVEKTLRSVMAQNELPAEWLIVDDGSTDLTREIVGEYLPRIPFLRLIIKPDRGFDAVGGGVVETFDYGMSQIETEDYTHLVKLDADIELPPDYFSFLLDHWQKDEQLGIISGQNYLPRKDGLAMEDHADFHPVGGARLYSRICYEEIDGLVQSPGWDTLDVIRAGMRGYRTCNYRDLKVIHLRDMSTRKGYAEGIQRLGRISWLLGYQPLYFLLRCLYRAKDRPYFLRSYYLALGYLRAWAGGERQIVSDAEIKYLRGFQLKRLGLSK